MFAFLTILAQTTHEAAAASSGNPAVDIAKGFHLDPWLFGAQCFNIIVVLIVLKKFAFGPLVAMLEQRRSRIAEGESNLVRIQQQLADSEKHTAEAIALANSEANRLVSEAKQSASILSEQKAQEAIAAAQNILAKAEAAARAEREQLSAELKREFGRLVTATTAQVTGKVLNDDDQKRINEEALTKVEA